MQTVECKCVRAFDFGISRRKRRKRIAKKKSTKRRNVQMKEVAKGSWAAWGKFSIPYKVQTGEEGIYQNIEHNCYEG